MIDLQELNRILSQVFYFNFRENSVAYTEKIIAVFTESLSDRTFVVDYERHYPIGIDFDILREVCSDMYPFINMNIVSTITMWW